MWVIGPNLFFLQHYLHHHLLCLFQECCCPFSLPWGSCQAKTKMNRNWPFFGLLDSYRWSVRLAWFFSQNFSFSYTFFLHSWKNSLHTFLKEKRRMHILYKIINPKSNGFFFEMSFRLKFLRLLTGAQFIFPFFLKKRK